LAIRNVAIRQRSTSAKSSRNQRIVVGIALLLGAGLLGFIAVTEDHHRYLDIGFAVFMTMAAVWDLSRVMRSRAGAK
jgi:hypothetical protein